MLAGEAQLVLGVEEALLVELAAYEVLQGVFCCWDADDDDDDEEEEVPLLVEEEEEFGGSMFEAVVPYWFRLPWIEKK